MTTERKPTFVGAEKLRKGHTDDVPEDAFTMPGAWVRVLHPRRGGVKVPAPKADPAAAATVAATLATHRETILACLALCSDPDIAAEGAAYLAGDRAATPLGAAAVVEVVTKCRGGSDAATLTAFADVWLAERGLAFAAVAGAELNSLRLGDRHHYHASDEYPLPVNRLPGAEGGNHWWGGNRIELLRRIRTAVATASDADHAEVVAALARCRRGEPQHRIAASYLAPTEADWVEADCEEAVGLGSGLALGLVAAIGTPAQAAMIAGRFHLFWVTGSLSLPATVVDAMGEEAVPVLTSWADTPQRTDHERRLLMMLAELPYDTAMRALIDRVGRRHGRPALLRAAARWPRRAMRMLAEAGGKAVGDLLRAHVLAHPELVDEVVREVGGAAAHRIVAIETTAAIPAAPAAALPEVLVNPPWTRPKKAREQVVIGDLTCVDEPAVVWGPGEREAWRSMAPDWVMGRELRWKKIAANLARGENRNGWADELSFFLCGPEDLARTLLGTWSPAHLYSASDWMRAVVARFELAALPLVVPLARRKPGLVAHALLPLATPEIAVLMAEWLTRLKSVRATALAWLTRHPDAAARALVPPALGKPGPARRQAEQALSALATNGDRDAVTRAAADHGPAAEAAIADLLAVGPLDALPTRMPVLPEWADPSVLTPIPLRGGAGALPVEAARHVLTMLAISRPGAPYAGLAPVKAACDARGLADFGWALFQRWQAAGHPSKEGWMMDALALIGDDETARRLAPLIRAWPGESAHQRAATGLDVLAGIGSEVALMHLHGIAEKVRFAGLKNQARHRMSEVAARLGLSSQELADRLVPDFGLAADGSLTLDYGPRKFVVGFDERLTPYVADSAGKRLKNLPKPGVKDDAELAPAAHQRFTGLKKDVRTVAADTIHRLERAMAHRRRWTVEEFTRLFVGHPLLWHITRRLVWGYYSDDTLVGTLRVAEDRGFADAGDETLTLPAGVTVGIVHPLELGETLSTWAEVFADYEIIQPFPQLGRDVYDPAAVDGAAFTRIPTGRVIGLERRGWRRGAPQDGGWQGWIERDVPGGGVVTIGLDPGVAIGYLDMEEEQIVMVEEGHFDGLDPITASEILRELHSVR
ncbi:DUF4132 domain-containing protein [Herbidospora sp. RD11066]